MPSIKRNGITGRSKSAPTVYWRPYIALRFTCNLQQNEEPTSRLEPLSCSSYEFVAYVLARSGASGIFACSGGFRRARANLVSVAYQPGCSTVAVKSFDQTRIADLLITGDNRGVARVCTGLASPGYLSRFLISAVPCVTPYCVRSGVRLVSKSLLYARLLAATSCWPFLSTSTPQLNQESSKASPEAVENFSLFPKLGRSGA
jgi:hypothetical protein